MNCYTAIKAMSGAILLGVASLLTSSFSAASTLPGMENRSKPPSELYSDKHFCRHLNNQVSGSSCEALNRVLLPAWNLASDAVIVPHRGLWGGYHDLVNSSDLNHSENTIGAFVAGFDNGFPLQEVDAIILQPQAAGSNYGGRSVTATHYFNMNAFKMQSASMPGNTGFLSYPLGNDIQEYKMWQLDDFVMRTFDTSFFPQFPYTWDRNLYE